MHESPIRNMEHCWDCGLCVKSFRCCLIISSAVSDPELPNDVHVFRTPYTSAYGSSRRERALIIGDQNMGLLFQETLLYTVFLSQEKCDTVSAATVSWLLACCKTYYNSPVLFCFLNCCSLVTGGGGEICLACFRKSVPWRAQKQVEVAALHISHIELEH